MEPVRRSNKSVELGRIKPPLVIEMTKLEGGGFSLIFFGQFLKGSPLLNFESSFFNKFRRVPPSALLKSLVISEGSPLLHYSFILNSEGPPLLYY